MFEDISHARDFLLECFLAVDSSCTLFQMSVCLTENRQTDFFIVIIQPVFGFVKPELDDVSPAFTKLSDIHEFTSSFKELIEMTNEFMSGILGNAIRSARIEKHLSQEQLAEIVGVTPTHLKHVESGHRKPSIDVLYKIIVELSLSLDNVFLPKKSKDTELYQRTVFFA